MTHHFQFSTTFTASSLLPPFSSLTPFPSFGLSWEPRVFICAATPIFPPNSSYTNSPRKNIRNMPQIGAFQLQLLFSSLHLRRLLFQMGTLHFMMCTFVWWGIVLDRRPASFLFLPYSSSSPSKSSWQGSWSSSVASLFAAHFSVSRLFVSFVLGGMMPFQEEEGRKGPAKEANKH